MNRRETIKLIGASALGTVAATGTASAQKHQDFEEDKTVYLGMCVGHYKHKEAADIFEKMERLSGMGFKYMDMVVDTKYGENYDIKKCKKVVDNLGIVPVQAGGGIPTWGTFDTAEKEKVLDKAKTYLDDCAYVGIHCTCILPPQWHEDLPFEVSWGTSIDYIRKYAELCKERGLAITVEVEPERDYISCRFRDAIAWLEHVDMDNVFLNVDTSHFTMWNYKAEWLGKYASMVVHTHITDNDGGKHQSWALGDGVTDNVGYYKALIDGGWPENARKHNIPPVACIELYIPGHTGDSFDPEIKQSISWVKENLPYMKLS
ncbi:sugar phosphate isomerase/epimerase family protein [Bacteroidota bacterium]